MNKIFIAIAAYRDPELIPTIKSCLAKAKYPQNLTFGICWQHDRSDKWDTLAAYKNDPRFRIIEKNAKESQGACWARSLTQTLYQNEQYTLQIDSHHRFVPNWDIKCIEMLTKLQHTGYPKPIITAYVPPYDPKKEEERNMDLWLMAFDKFTPEGVVLFVPKLITERITEPITSRFISGHFLFTLGQFQREILYDPDFYFHGEEISLSVRAFTSGYDLFHPHQIIVWHEYTRKARSKHWDDHPTWSLRDQKSFSRNRKLLNIDGQTPDPSESDLLPGGKYGLGTVRSLADYENYAGINFKTRSVEPVTVKAIVPTRFKLSSVCFSNIDYTLHLKSKPLPSHLFWAIIFEDRDGNQIYRKDLNCSELSSSIKCSLATSPSKWIIWPYSQQGWENRLEWIIYSN